MSQLDIRYLSKSRWADIALRFPQAKTLKINGLLIALAFEWHQERLLHRFGHPAQETGGICAIDQPVVIRERQGQHQPGLELLFNISRLETRSRHSENRHLGPVHDGRERCPADAAQVRD